MHLSLLLTIHSKNLTTLFTDESIVCQTMYKAQAYKIYKFAVCSTITVTNSSLKNLYHNITYIFITIVLCTRTHINIAVNTSHSYVRLSEFVVGPEIYILYTKMPLDV